MTENSLLVKYRPIVWEDVIGQPKVVKSLSGALAKAHAFLLIGPSGCGKTTLARIAAEQLQAEVSEIDAARYTGIDDMRAVADELMYRPMGSAKKAIILDEAHMLSKSAVTSLLKVVEHPPEWGYWFFCTTEAIKIPAAMKTRCITYQLQPVSFQELYMLLDDIVVAEKFKLSKEIIELCAREAGGSPRQAIANLTTCLAAQSKGDAAELLATAAESPQAIDLARMLYGGKRWSEVQALLGNMNGVSSESIRQVVRAYGTKVALGAKREQDAGRALEVLAQFAEPFNPHDGITPVILACARLLLS